jgi:hypothetical protein
MKEMEPGLLYCAVFAVSATARVNKDENVRNYAVPDPRFAYFINPPPGGWSGWQSIPSYFLYSSVTGEKITDLDDTGAYLQTHIYMGHTDIARQDASNVRWKLTDPISGSTRETSPDGSLPSGDEEETRVELAGLGTYVPHIDTQGPPPPHVERGSWAGDPEYACTRRGLRYMWLACTEARQEAEWETALGISMSNAAAAAAAKKKTGPLSMRVVSKEPKQPFAPPQNDPSSGLAFAAGGSSMFSNAAFRELDRPSIGEFTVDVDASVPFEQVNAEFSFDTNDCEKKLAKIFSNDPDATFVDVTDGDGFDPVLGYDRTPRDANDDEHNHLYNSAQTPNAATNVLAPVGGEVIGKGEWDGQNYLSLFYPNLGGSKDVVLQIWHVEGSAKPKAQDGRLLLGQMGENGTIGYLAVTGKPDGYHIHINAYSWWGSVKKKRGRRIPVGNALGSRKIKERHRLRLSDLLC